MSHHHIIVFTFGLKASLEMLCHNIHAGNKLASLLHSETMTGEIVGRLLQAMHIYSNVQTEAKWV